ALFAANSEARCWSQALDRVPSVLISSTPLKVNDEVGRPNPRRLQRGGRLRDLSRPRERRVPGEPGLSATPSHAVGSRSVRPVLASGEARATRAPIQTEW